MIQLIHVRTKVKQNGDQEQNKTGAVAKHLYQLPLAELNVQRCSHTRRLAVQFRFQDAECILGTIAWGGGGRGFLGDHMDFSRRQ